MFDYSNKTVLVTGGTSGIGLAIVRQLAAAGAHVYVNSESEEACRATVGGLTANGQTAAAMPADMASEGGALALATRVTNEVGRLDVLFVNAGVTGAKLHGDDGYEDDVRRVFEINIQAPRILCENLLPVMAENGGGAAVLTASLAGLRGNRRMGSYSLTKAAVAQLARDMAVKFGPDGVRVNAVSPGLIATGWEKAVLANPDAAARRMQMTPLRRIGRPEEIANVALFLGSDLASFVTGHNLVADGGTLITDGN